MVRSKLLNEFNKSRTSESWLKYKQQRNKCLYILKWTKTNYFNNLNPNSLYIYWECETIHSTSYLKFRNMQLLHLFADMYMLNFFLKWHDFARLIFVFEKFQEMGTESIAFQLVIFQYLRKHFTKIVHWTHYGIIIESSKFLSKCSCSWFGLLRLFFPCKLPEWNTFFLIGIHSMHGWTSTARNGVARKRSTKRLKHTENLFRKELHLIGVY